MFNVSCKDPLESEKIGQRRERKAQETQDGIDSINVVLSNRASSATTPMSPTWAFSAPASGRSSRTSDLDSSIFKDDTSIPQKLGTSIRGYFISKTSSSPARPKSQRSKKGRRELEASLPPFAPFPQSVSQPKSISPPNQPEDWQHVDPSMLASPQPREVPFCTGSLPPMQMPKLNPQAAHEQRCRRLLRKIEMASDKVIATRLQDKWPAEHENEVDMMHEFHIETALYGFVYLQKMASLQFPGHDGDPFLAAGGLHPEDYGVLENGNILHLSATSGSPESWYLGTKLPQATIHSLGLKDLPFDLSSSSWGLPPNVNLEEWMNCPQLDYVDEIFDAVVITHQLFESVRCTLWPLLFEQISRVLAPNGLLIVSVMDALPEQSGTLLEHWINDNIYLNILRRFLVYRPSLLLPSWLEENGHFTDVQVHHMQFPCMPVLQAGAPVVDTRSLTAHGRRKSYSSMPAVDRLDQIKENSVVGNSEQLLAASLAGWHCYERLYADFLPEASAHRRRTDGFNTQPAALSRGWWLCDHDVRTECQQNQPYFEMTTFVFRATQPM